MKIFGSNGKNWKIFTISPPPLASLMVTSMVSSMIYMPIKGDKFHLFLTLLSPLSKSFLSIKCSYFWYILEHVLGRNFPVFGSRIRRRCSYSNFLNSCIMFLWNVIWHLWILYMHRENGFIHGEYAYMLSCIVWYHVLLVPTDYLQTIGTHQIYMYLGFFSSMTSICDHGLLLLGIGPVCRERN